MFKLINKVYLWMIWDSTILRMLFSSDTLAKHLCKKGHRKGTCQPWSYEGRWEECGQCGKLWEDSFKER